MDEVGLQLLGEEGGYLVVPGVVVLEGVPVVGGLVGGREAGQVEGLGADLVEVQVEEAEALDLSCLQAYQEASGTEEHLVVGQEVGQTVDLEDALEELGVDPVAEAQSLVDLACVEGLAVPPDQQEGVDADWA